jgi:hypothetical protein
MQRSTYLNVLKSQHVIRLHVQRFVVETIALQYWLPRFVFHFALYVKDDHITFRHCSVDDSEWDITSIKVTGLTSHSNDNKSEMGRTVNLATSATITVGSAITHSRLWPLILVLYYNKFHSIEYGTKLKTWCADFCCMTNHKVHGVGQIQIKAVDSTFSLFRISFSDGR